MPGRVFVGQRKEGFAVNLGRVFDLVNLVPVEGDSAPGAGDGGGFPGGITQSRANNIVDNANVTTIALELHKSCLTGTGNGVIGGWTSARLRQARLLNPLPTFARPEVDGGPWVQVSRLGMPLVNELVIGLPDKDRFSASEPTLRRSVRHLRDEPDAAGAARRAVPRSGEPDAGHEHRESRA